MKVTANGLQIEVDVQGPASGDPLLLIMGLGMPLVGWPDGLVDGLVQRGFRVIRMDNRDVGLSQGFEALGPPRMGPAMLRYLLHLPVTAPYRLADMADDALGVLDALGIAQAHVVGASMGGMIGQHLAASHPQRVKSLGLVMSTSGRRSLPQPSWAVRQQLIKRPASPALPDVVAHLERTLAVIGSPAYRPDAAQLHQRLEAMVRRAWRPEGTARQLMAVVADGDRSRLLGRIRARTLVIHGQDDPLVPVAAGHDLQRQIAGARIELIPGMGHDLPLALLPRLAGLIATHAAGG